MAAAEARLNAQLQAMLAMGRAPAAYANYLLNSPTAVTIAWTSTGGGHGGSAIGRPTIELNYTTPNYLPPGSTATAQIQNDPTGDIAAQTVIGHEAGHAIPELQLTDPGPLSRPGMTSPSGANVTLSENPVLEANGQATRPSYVNSQGTATPVPSIDNVDEEELAHYHEFMSNYSVDGTDTQGNFSSHDVPPLVARPMAPAQEDELPDIGPIDLPELSEPPAEPPFMVELSEEGDA